MLKNNPRRSILKSPSPLFQRGNREDGKPIDFDFMKFDDPVFAVSPKNKPLDISPNLVKFYGDEI
jgi:hypothetical protein